MTKKKKPTSKVVEVPSSQLRDEIRRVYADTLSAAIEAAGELVAPHLTNSGRHFPLKGKTVHLAPKAPETAQNAAGFLIFADSFPEFVKDATTDELRESTFFLGSSAAEMLSSFIVGKTTSKVLNAYSRISDGGKEGTKVTNADHVEKHPQYQPKVDRLIKDGLSYSAACEEVAASLRVSDRTVKRHTENPAPRNRGRRR